MVAQGLIFTCSSMFQGLGNTKPVLLASAMRVAAFICTSIWLSTWPGFQIEYVWYLSVAATPLQAAHSVWLLRREFGKRLVTRQQEEFPSSRRPSPLRLRYASPRSEDAALAAHPRLRLVCRAAE